MSRSLAVVALLCLSVFAEDSTQTWKLMGVPFAKYRTEFGPGFGAKVALFQFAADSAASGFAGRTYTYSLEGQSYASLEGMQEHVLYFRVPRTKRWSLDMDAELRMEVVDNSRYFGIGNGTRYHTGFIESGNPEFRSGGYYEYRRVRPRFVTQVLKPLPFRLKALVGMGAHHTGIETPGSGPSAAANLLREEDPHGMEGGFTNFFKFGLVLDTRDYFASPTRGIWTDLTAELAGPHAGSDYAYRRYTAINRIYVPLAGRVVFANRIGFEWMDGSPPFYELSFLGGSATQTEGLGGDKILRGYAQNRFIDRSKIFGNNELRARFFKYRHGREDFEASAVVFADIGRVYASPSDFTLEGLHHSRGAGLRIGWNRYFIGRADVGHSRDGIGISIGFADVF